MSIQKFSVWVKWWELVAQAQNSIPSKVVKIFSLLVDWLYLTTAEDPWSKQHSN